MGKMREYLAKKRAKVGGRKKEPSEGGGVERSATEFVRDKVESGHRTDIEALVEEELKRRGEEYQFEARLGIWHVDFFLPQRNLVIECDGEYWHRSREALGSDLNKTLDLREKGYRVARLMFGKEVRYETVKGQLDELLEGKKASFKTVLTPRLRRFAIQWIKELQQREHVSVSFKGGLRVETRTYAPVAYIEKLQRLLDEDKGAVSLRESIRQKLKAVLGISVLAMLMFTLGNRISRS